MSAVQQHAPSTQEKKETKQYRLVETGTETVDMDALLSADL